MYCHLIHSSNPINIFLHRHDFTERPFPRPNKQNYKPKKKQEKNPSSEQSYHHSDFTRFYRLFFISISRSTTCSGHLGGYGLDDRVFLAEHPHEDELHEVGVDGEEVGAAVALGAGEGVVCAGAEGGVVRGVWEEDIFEGSELDGEREGCQFRNIEEFDLVLQGGL